MYGQRFPNRVTNNRLRHPATSHSTSSTRSRHPLKKNGLYKVRYCSPTITRNRFCWAEKDGGRRMGWMRCCLVGWTLSTVSRSCSSSTPTFPLCTWDARIRFTDKKVFLDRLYSKGRVLGHKRAKRNSSPNTSLLQIDGVGSKEEAQFYLGKVRRFPRIISIHKT